MYIIKRNGRKQKFNILKVQKAYTKALKETSTEFTEELIKNINSYVENNLKENISVEEIQDLVEIALAKSDLMEAAKHFIIYRDKHNTYRSYIKDILDHFENKDLFYEVLRNGQKKYKELAPSYNKLLVKFKSFLKPKYTEQEAINALIKASLECTTAEEPNWEYISGNIYTCYNNYLIKQFDEQFETWHDKLIYLCDNNYYHEFVKNEYDKEEIMFFYEYMNKVHKERSYLLNYSGSELLFKRYVIRSRDNKPLETPIEMFMGISMFLNRKENKNTRTQLVVNLFDILSTLKVTMATPTMNNARKPYHQLSSCFIDTMPDSLTGIYRSTTNFAQISKLGGGMGMYVGKIRASGSDIRGFKGVAAGVIPWVKLLNSTAVAVDQIGCVASNSYVKVLDYIVTNNYKHQFFKRCEKYIFKYKEEDIELILNSALKYIPKYNTLSEENRKQLIYDYCSGFYNLNYLCNKYNLNRQQYKKFIGRFKKNKKELPNGFKYVDVDNNYAINKNGVIINVYNFRKINSYRLNLKGYICVTLNKTQYTLHKLLYTNFKGEINNKTIDHIDGNIKNNNLDNLTVLSNEDNISKGWTNEYNKNKRIEKIILKGFISNNKELCGKRSKLKNRKFEIIEIKTKTIKIGDVRVGDIILSLNEKNNKTTFKEVLKTHNIIVKKENQIKITYDGGSYIVTSLWHPTYTKTKEHDFKFIRADEVKVGDFGMSENGLAKKVISIDLNPNYDENYKDLTIKDTECYFVSTDNLNNEMFLIHNTRAGSCACYIDVWHKDVLQMLQIRTNNGDDRMKAHDIFPAICYPDYFWKQVDTNMNNIWYLMCPKEIYDVMGYRLEDCFGEEWETKYKECIANPDINKHEIVIKDLVRLILKSVIETGTPFAFNRDIANKFNPNNHIGNIYSSNLCVSGDTKILTDKGYIPMKENEGRSVNVWNGKQWSETTIVKTGENQELLEIEFSNGSIIKCTPYHKFYVLKQYPLGNNNFRNTEEETRAIDLKINDELFRYKLPDTENFQRGIKVVSINKVEGLHDTFCVNEPLRHKVIFNGVITGNCVEIIQNMAPIQDGESYLKDGIVTETSIPGEMVVCNLASLVLPRINWKSDEEVEFIISTIIRTLDNVIDNNYYPVPYAESTNQKYRALGLGMQGYHHLLVKNGIKWESDKHLEFADKIFEKINYYAIKASNNLAKEKGVYTYFEGSDWHTGAYFDKRNYISEKWIQLKEDVSKFGMRNAYLLALAPTGSTSYVAGTSACADPIMNKFFLEEKRSSTVPRVAPELNDKTWWLYKSAYDIDQVWSMRAAGVRQRHIDQSQSTNLYITNEYSLKQVLNLYLEAWKNGIKTIYYVRSKSLEVEECESCAS